MSRGRVEDTQRLHKPFTLVRIQPPLPVRKEGEVLCHRFYYKILAEVKP